MIETKRLILRRLVLSDHAALETLLGNDEVMESSDDGPLTTEQVGAWLQGHIKGYENNTGIEILAVDHRSTSEFIGYCGLTEYPDIDGLCEIEVGYRLMRKFWGYGYATEAACAIRDYAFSELNLPRLVALIEPVNKRSIGVARKLGMKLEKDVMMEGYDHPDHLYTMSSKGQNA
jgi:RimJ/RimL family protein N-acetyltransferase